MAAQMIERMFVGLALIASAAAFVPSSLAPSLSCTTCSTSMFAGLGRQPLKTLQLRQATTAFDLNMQIKGVYSDNNEKPKANKELMQIRFATVDADKLGKWLKKWPFGTKKDGYGLPKTMLPLAAEPYGAGVKIIFKGTADPWLQVDLEGDTIRVYRQSMMSTNFLQVSALKQREETKICEKLKEDLGTADCGAKGLNEKAIPVIEPTKKEEPAAEEPLAPAAEEAPAS